MDPQQLREQESRDIQKHREQNAKQPQFVIAKYPLLRSSDDFARVVLFVQKEAKNKFLEFQDYPMHKSLTILSYYDSILATELHLKLMAYMGTEYKAAKRFSFLDCDCFPSIPNTWKVAHDILQTGYEHVMMRDEIFLQVIKQMTNNPKQESILRGYQFLCMCVHIFPPSTEFMDYFFHFLLDQRDHGEEPLSNYARYALSVLHENLHDPQFALLSLEQMIAYKDRPPLLETIHLLDGRSIPMTIPPHDTVNEVLDRCIAQLQFPHSTKTMLGLFVEDLGRKNRIRMKGELNEEQTQPYAALPRTPALLQEQEWIGDVYTQYTEQKKRRYRLVLKCKILSPSLPIVVAPEKKESFMDPMVLKMIFAQAEDDVLLQGNVKIETVQEVAYLTAISLVLAFGVRVPDSVKAFAISGMEVNDYLPPSWRVTEESTTMMTTQDWIEQIVQHRATLVTLPREQLQQEYLNVISRYPLYGCHWFYVYKQQRETAGGVIAVTSVHSLPKDLAIAFNHQGVHICTIDRQLLQTISYPRIVTWKETKTSLSIFVQHEGRGTNSNNDTSELILITAQSTAIVNILMMFRECTIVNSEQK